MSTHAPLTSEQLRTVMRGFRMAGDFVAAAPYGNGHINDSFAVVYNQAGVNVRYLAQRINQRVFPDVAGLMSNVERVCTHAQSRLETGGVSDASRRALTLIPTREGKAYFIDVDGGCWRTYLFIENATGHDVVKSEKLAYEAAKAFGEFQKLLVDLPGGRLNETIRNFHQTETRYAAFEAALKENSHARAEEADEEIQFALRHRSLASSLLDLMRSGKIPERPTHNDTKLNNVLMDDATQTAVCVIDLDTLMPGLSLYDFGDLVRTSTSPAVEDEQDLSKVRMRPEMFDALARGYLESAASFLNGDEIKNLPLGGMVITYECGLRFLTDYLRGDTYFKIKRPLHNLERCRTQFTLMDSMSEQWEALEKRIEELAFECST